MDQIINFLEQYWGISIFGSVTLGTLITFIITQIKIILKDKVQSAAVTAAVNKADMLCNELEKREEQHKQERALLETQLTQQQQQIAEKEAYFENVQAATFQAISYLVIASKLPTEDKIALQEKFTTLVKTKQVEYTEILKDEVHAVVNEVTEKVVPDVFNSVEQTVNETKTLLDRYTKEV